MELKEGMIIHCKTEEEAKELIKLAYEQGFKWIGGSDNDDTHFNVYYEDTIYLLGVFSSSHNDIVYGTINSKNKNEVIEYSDLIKRDYKDFKKSDLKNGMVVETREGKRYLVHNNKLLHSDGNTYMALDGVSGFDDDLKDTYAYDNRYDIMRVYKSKAHLLKLLFLDNYLTLIWEREEKQEEKTELKISDYVKIKSNRDKASILNNTYIYDYDLILESNLSENDKSYLLAKFNYGEMPEKHKKYTVEYIGLHPKRIEEYNYAIISDFNNCFIVDTEILEKYDK